MTDRIDAFVQRHGPWAVVTGASDGIGRSFAGALASRGLNVVLIARRQQVLESLATSLSGAHGVRCRVVAADLAAPDGVDRVLASSAGLDVGLVVCAAGFGTAGPFVQGDLETELAMLQVNCAAPTSIAWHFGRRLVARRRGALILLSSIVAFQGVPRSAHYAATKAYVQTLAEGLRAEWADSGVDVLSVAPGPVGTGFAARSGLRMGRTEHPDVVAAESLEALGRRGTVRPGRMSKVLGYGLAMTPRWGRIRIMGGVMRTMTRHLDA